ncbi:MAG: tyrosine-type recombinase/integrase [Candidatus Rokuibacteriota bacterium]
MLKPSIDAYLALRRAVGFHLETEERLLHDFARWASDRGETHVRTQTATEWAAAARATWQRERRLRAVAGFARHARAEDGRHEVPPICVFGRRHVRPRPHIYSPDELACLLDAASRLPPTWPLKPQVFTTLLGLLASTGLRISEALGLRFGDVTTDGLVVHKTKFNKSRLVPLHATTATALDRYLDLRRRSSTVSDYVFVSPRGDRLPHSTVAKWFLRLARQTGLRSGPGAPGPRIHDLRHTFAVRALEACPQGGSPVGWRMRALSTYLGHVNVADTCWYLHATPQLMRGVADSCERFLEGGTR